MSTNSVLYTYNAAGTYTVTLIVTGIGTASTNSQPNYITALTPFQAWQVYYFGSTTNLDAAPSVDYDGTGMSNSNKFMAGFNPADAAAYLHIIGIAKTGTNSITVTYLGASGDNTYSPGIMSRTNVLEFATGTSNGSYTNNFSSTGQANILSGGNGLGTVTNMTDFGGATNGPSRYYRVRVLVP